VAEAKRLAKSMALEAISLGGTCTGEHGVGVGKKELLQHEMGPGTMAVMQIIKRGFDPQGILNPGKILDVDVEIRGKEGKGSSGLCS
jgi:D-lactate dehydrogenase (cytochrome)